MEATIYINFLKTMGYVCSILGVIVGIDLILGARVTSSMKRILEKSYDLEGALKRALEHKTFEFDKIVDTPRAKMALGIIFFGFSIVIFLLLRQI